MNSGVDTVLMPRTTVKVERTRSVDIAFPIRLETNPRHYLHVQTEDVRMWYLQNWSVDFPWFCGFAINAMAFVEVWHRVARSRSLVVFCFARYYSKPGR